MQMELAARDPETSATASTECTESLFAVSVGTLPAGAAVIVSISYVTELYVDRDELRFRLQKSVAPHWNAVLPPPFQDPAGLRPADYEIASGVELQMTWFHSGARISRITSPSAHAFVTVNSFSPTSTTPEPAAGVGSRRPAPTVEPEGVTVRARMPSMDDEIIFAAHLTNMHELRVAVEHCTETKTCATLTTLCPAAGNEAQCELVFLVDRSGSMDHTTLDLVRQLMTVFLRCMPPRTPFNIISYGSQFEMLSPTGSQPLTPETVLVATEYLSRMQANFGGTDLLTPLRAVLQTPPLSATQRRQIFVLSDGQNPGLQGVLDMLRVLRGSSRVFAVGLGNDPNPNLIEGLAEVGHGIADYVSSLDRLQEKVMRLLRRALSPYLSDIAVTWRPDASDTAPPMTPVFEAPAKLPLVGSGARVLHYAVIPVAKTDSASAGEELTPVRVDLVATSSTGPMQLSVTVTTELRVVSSSKEAILHRLAARARLADLEMMAHPTPAQLAELVALSQLHRLGSSSTVVRVVDTSGASSTALVPALYHPGHRSFAATRLAEARTDFDRQLRFSAMDGDSSDVKALLSRHTNLDLDSALHLAAENGQTAIVNLLLESGADAESKRRLSTAFSKAYREEHFSTAASICRKLSDASLRALSHEQLLRTLSASLSLLDRVLIIKLFTVSLSLGVDPIPSLLSLDPEIKHRVVGYLDGLSPDSLRDMSAAGGNYFFILRNQQNKSVIHLVRDRHDFPLFHFLLTKNAKNGLSVLHIAASAGDVDFVRELLDWGANVHDCDASGMTPLHLAAIHDRVAIAELLVLRGADFQASAVPTNRWERSVLGGRKPIDVAKRNGAVAAILRNYVSAKSLRIVVLGATGVGKSSLISTMATERDTIAAPPRGNGDLQMREKLFGVIRTQLWESGKPSVCEDTIELFPAARVLFLVVANPDSESGVSFQTDVHHWLRLLSLHAIQAALTTSEQTTSSGSAASAVSLSLGSASAAASPAPAAPMLSPIFFKPAVLLVFSHRDSVSATEASLIPFIEHVRTMYGSVLDVFVQADGKTPLWVNTTRWLGHVDTVVQRCISIAEKDVLLRTRTGVPKEFPLVRDQLVALRRTHRWLPAREAVRRLYPLLLQKGVQVTAELLSDVIQWLSDCGDIIRVPGAVELSVPPAGVVAAPSFSASLASAAASPSALPISAAAQQPPLPSRPSVAVLPDARSSARLPQPSGSAASSSRGLQASTRLSSANLLSSMSFSEAGIPNDTLFLDIPWLAASIVAMFSDSRLLARFVPVGGYLLERAVVDEGIVSSILAEAFPGPEASTIGARPSAAAVLGALQRVGMCFPLTIAEQPEGPGSAHKTHWYERTPWAECGAALPASWHDSDQLVLITVTIVHCYLTFDPLVLPGLADYRDQVPLRIAQSWGIAEHEQRFVLSKFDEAARTLSVKVEYKSRYLLPALLHSPTEPEPTTSPKIAAEDIASAGGLAIRFQCSLPHMLFPTRVYLHLLLALYGTIVDVSAAANGSFARNASQFVSYFSSACNVTVALDQGERRDEDRHRILTVSVQPSSSNSSSARCSRVLFQIARLAQFVLDAMPQPLGYVALDRLPAFASLQLEAVSEPSPQLCVAVSRGPSSTQGPTAGTVEFITQGAEIVRHELSVASSESVRITAPDAEAVAVRVLVSGVDIATAVFRRGDDQCFRASAQASDYIDILLPALCLEAATSAFEQYQARSITLSAALGHLQDATERELLWSSVAQLPFNAVVKPLVSCAAACARESGADQQPLGVRGAFYTVSAAERTIVVRAESFDAFEALQQLHDSPVAKKTVTTGTRAQVLATGSSDALAAAAEIANALVPVLDTVTADGGIWWVCGHGFGGTAAALAVARLGDRPNLSAALFGADCSLVPENFARCYFLHLLSDPVPRAAIRRALENRRSFGGTQILVDGDSVGVAGPSSAAQREAALRTIVYARKVDAATHNAATYAQAVARLV
eukprot:TRINITY_DN1994_c0_g1_i1.p1 TRINITY_DN1994_c0_g1~~TRINITY_DN1994_c0_g1_i1.p1  ORF type:complete len:2081 (-),score=391.13 TRINITY_DN1994_c0_g1_i1:13-5943(-)